MEAIQSSGQWCYLLLGESFGKNKKKEQAKLFMVPQKCEKYENGADVLV